jgi:hypothetical protein
MPRKKKEVKEEKKEVELVLTQVEMSRYETASLNTRIKQLEKKIIELKRDNFAIAKENSDLQIKLCGYEAVDKERSLREFRESHKKFNEDVCKRLELEDNRFGYNPLTGVVIPYNKGEDV